MNFLTVFCFLSALSRIRSNTVSSPQIRILDVATKASETRLIPHLAEYRNSFEPYLQQRNTRPLESYVIYDQYPFKIFKKWKASPPADFPGPVPQNYLEFNRRPGAEFPPDYYFQNRQEVLPPPKPTLAYRSVYSNVIKVFDNSLEGIDRSRFPGERYMKPFEGGIWKPPIEYELLHPQDVPQRQLYHSLKLPENFPKVFSPNEKFHFPSFEEEVAGPPKFFYPQGGYYDTHTINYNKENVRHRDEVEVLPEKAFGVRKNQKKTFLCSFIRVNQRQFPEGGNPCGRSDDDLPLVPPEYPDYSNLPNDKIPVEHRRQHIQIKRIKRSELNESYETRQKRNAGFGYSSWSSPFGYESGYEGYFGDNYQRSRSRYRNQGSRNKYSSGSRYDDYDDDYQNEDSNSKGLTGYLTNGGRRYKNRKNNNDEEDENEDENNNNNDNNRDEDSDEEMERMNSNRRDSNDRRNSDDRDRRRNNNNNSYNDEDDNRDNRRNNNRNSNRRYNNNNRRYNDRYDNNNRNRYYSNNNSNNNGYGGSYGGYGSSYGGNGGYGSSYGGNGGYGSSYGGNGGYGSSYGSSYGGNGGYGYGGYGNGFGSF